MSEVQEQTVSTPKTLSRRNVLKSGGAMAALGGFATLPITLKDVKAQGGWSRETDVVVVGTGAAGTPAAIEAARAGAEVLRLEKVEVVGGNMSHSQGIIYLGGGTDLQKKHGVEDTPDMMFAYLSSFMSPWEDDEIVRLYSDSAVEHYNWLVNEGVPFGQDYYPSKMVNPPDFVGGLNYCGNEVNYPYNEITPPAARGHCVTGGGAAMSVALQAAADAEPNITTEVNAPVIGLVQNDEGRVVGVVAQINGAEERILARKGVILGTGGYEFNEEMKQRTIGDKFPELFWVGAAYKGNTGDGIRMAGGIGARLRNMDQTFHTIFAYPPEEKCQGVMVNGHGRRFVNEASYGIVIGTEIIYRQNGIAWLLMDQAIADSVTAAGGDVSSAVVADTLAELADLIEVPASILEGEIALYNQHAEAKFDELYRKPEEFLTPFGDGPFYALNYRADNGATAAMTAGHIEVDIESRVLDMNLEPIPGLYAAGQGACAVGRLFYNSGIRLGEGSFFGRRAGKHAAAAEAWTGEGATAFLSPAPGLDAATAEASPEAGASIEDATVTVEAFDIGFVETEIQIAADTDTVIGLINNGAIPHDLVIEDTEFATPIINGGETAAIVVNLPAGEYTYYCSVAGHRAAGMEGTLVVA